MPQSKLIIDLNRHLEPNAFNTGPAIPKSLPPFPSNEIYSPFPQSGSFFPVPSSMEVPDLSASPASTISSTSLTLEDDEIKRIFSHPRYGASDGAPCDLQQYISWYRQSHLPYSPDRMRKDNLNPKALPFVPSYNLSGSPQKSGVITCSDLRTGTNDINPSRQAPSLHPPGLSIPATNFSPSLVSGSLGAEASRQPEPRYVAILLDCLKPTTTPRDRKTLVKFIIADTAVWNMESLLDLAERLCDAACNPGPDCSKDGQPTSTCHFLRYFPSNHVSTESDCLMVEEYQKPEDVSAVAAELYQHFLNFKGEETAQMFAWNVREIVLMQFIQSWDFVKPESISYEIRPSPRFVRSSLYLCKTIAALFKQDIIGREHISMCISVLLKNLMSVEHAEAIYNLILGCGQLFWEPSSSLEDSHLDFSRDAVLQLNCHVHDFITGLHANFMNNDLRDSMSVVEQPWGEGQLLAVLAEIVDHVREWEGGLVSKLHQQ